jgi:4-alpha-glucanotransferase
MSEKSNLRRLARHYGIQASYYDIFGRLNQPPAEALLSVLRMLGAHAENISDVAGALRERQQSLCQEVVDPVTVAWDGAALALKIRLPRQLADTPVHYAVALEDGGAIEGVLRDDPKVKSALREIAATRYVARRLRGGERIPFGYHRLRLRIGDLQIENFLFSAPAEAYGAGGARQRGWGLFCPLYALASANSWGVGDFSDLGAMVDFAGELGGQAVGTLPLFGTFLDEPFNPSPYSPVTRLFWSELYLDVTRIAELEDCAAARSVMQAVDFQTELKALRADRLIDYRRLMGLKRKVLHELLSCLLTQPSERRVQFERFVAAHPQAQDYAAFRAKTDGLRKPWQQWDGPSRDGTLRPGDYVEATKQYHLYVQWQCDEQMRALGEKTKAGGPALYLDFPLGVNRDGYDVWRERDAFALEASGGAPPDGFFTKGQNWGFPPFHPEGLRRQGYRYYIGCVRRHLQYAKRLRIDHVMGLHRFYWVPEGFAPTEGVYVRYPMEEFFAVLSLESHRHEAQIVGENLGTVAPAINAAMARHHILGMHVGQFGVTDNPEQALDDAPDQVVASLNTHDTPTFAGFWSGADIDDRRELGLLSDEEVVTERAGRERQRRALSAYLKARGLVDGDAPDAAAVLRGWLAYLAAGDSDFLLINLEDLWLEVLPQNVPGTWQERPNWRRKSRYSLEQIRALPALRETLLTIDRLRKRGNESEA